LYRGREGIAPLVSEDASVTPSLCRVAFLVPMSKQRMVRDSFWTDSYIEKLSPDEKLLFIYLLTNPLCNVLGIYEIRAKRIGFETGYDVEVVENILERFERDKKILRHNDFIVLVNHVKNQSTNPSIIQGCQRIFDEMSDEIKSRVTGWVQAGLLNLTLLNLTLPNPTKPKSSEDSKKKIVSMDSFNDFWNVYPKKAGKGAAEKAWEKMNPDIVVVLSSLEEHKKTDQWSKDSGKFIPHPATWLNQKRWEDEVEIKNTSTKYSKYDS